MGNCMRSGSNRAAAKLKGDQMIMVMKTDGKILELTAPILVGDLTVAYPRHSLVHSGDLCRSLSPDYMLLPGQFYCLLPFPNSPSRVSKDNNHLEDAVLSEASTIDNGSSEGRIGGEGHENASPSSGKPMRNGRGIIRVKIVISKKELETLLSDRCMSKEQLWVELQCRAEHVKEDYAAKRCDGAWRPSLDSIPEVN